MSYDIELYSKKTGEVVAEFNITYNVSEMFYSCWPEEGIRKIYDLSGDDSLEHLLDLHEHLILQYDEMKTYEPSNGWGSWQNTVKCINKMCMVATQNPKCFWKGD